MQLVSHLFFLSEPPRFLLQTKRFASIEDSLGASALGYLSKTIFGGNSRKNLIFQTCIYMS